MGKTSFFFILFLLPVLFLPLPAGEKDAKESFEKGLRKESSGSGYRAGKCFLDAVVYSDDPIMKANALMNAARCFRKAEFYCEEFDCLQTLIKQHLNRIDFGAVTARQFEIAELVARGHRDLYHPWIPFIRKDSRKEEIMKKTLENAPCAKPAAALRLRLGKMYLEDQKIRDSRKELTETVKLYPGTEEARLASLEIANLCLQQAERGDGNGKYAREAMVLLDDFLKKYPEDSESEWVKNAKQRIYNCTAKRYYEMAVYYRKEGRSDIAQRYLATVIRDYPLAKEAPQAEVMLAELDQGYKISKRPWTPTVLQFKMQAFPVEYEETLQIPSEDGNHYLLPVRNLKGNIIPADRKKKKETVTDDML